MANSLKKVYPKMDRANRAKQFMPFDALKGFREALAEKERVLVNRKEFSEEQKEELNRKLCQLQKMDMVTVEFFRNGQYVNLTGILTKIDMHRRSILIGDTEIFFDDIADLSS